MNVLKKRETMNKFKEEINIIDSWQEIKQKIEEEEYKRQEEERRYNTEKYYGVEGIF